MSIDGYYGDFDSLADEQRAYRQYMERQAEEEAAREEWEQEQRKQSQHPTPPTEGGTQEGEQK